MIRLHLAFLTLALLAFPSSMQAASLEESVADVVVKLTKYLESKNEKRISIGQFVGPPQLSATSGPGISKVFHDEFAKHGIEVQRRCNIGLRGEFSLVNAVEGQLAVRLNCSLVDPLGQVLTDFSVDAQLVDKHQDIAQLTGATTTLHPEDLPREQSSDLKESLLGPTIHLTSGTKCSAGSESPYQIEIVAAGRPLTVDVADGLGFVKLNRGQTYRIRLYNNSNFDAAVQVTIDGLNVFSFSKIRNPTTGKPRYSVYVVPARRYVELIGWHRTNEVVDSFLVTSYAESAAATIDHQQNIGTITAVFAAAWPKNGDPPLDEDMIGRGGNATGFGPPVEQVVQETERQIGQMRASISLRYDK